ncbi:MAG: tetratricopeptide repeat protein [Panacibacter sp.]
MKKTTLTLFSVVLATSITVAQSLEDGIKFLYYERTRSAVETLEKVVASNSKDPKSIYWLGQAYLDQYSESGDKADIGKAKALYQKALTDGVNDPWIWVGVGHVELMEGGDKNAARQRFDQAITAVTPTRGKNKGNPDTDILNAVGRANADGSSKQGDPLYGIEKLKQAAELNLTDPDIDINLGICYLKLGSDKGGEAVQAFTDAIRRNPQYAEAYYRIGKVYQSQSNVEFMNEWFGKAISADPNYGPVYLTYFNYYKERDVNAAKEFLDKYVANADKDCSVDYFVADYLYRAGKNDESIAKAKEMENGECRDYKRVNIIYAYNYNKLGDDAAAKSAIQKYFSVAAADKIELSDYIIAATILSKDSTTRDSAVAYLTKAYDADTSQKNKLMYIDSISGIYKRAKDYENRLEWVRKGYNMNPAPSNRDIYDFGEAAYFAQKYPLADSLFGVYEEKFPDQVYGFMWRYKVAQAADTTMESGIIVAPSVSYINFLKTDSVKYNSTLISVNGTLAGYYANVKKDKDSAIYYLQQILIYDPTNQDAQKYIDILKKSAGGTSSNSNEKSDKSPADKSRNSGEGKK